MDRTKSMRLVFSILVFSCIGLMPVVFTSCNKDDVIENSAEKKPVITLDSETGVYTVKTGREITISPTVENTNGAIYSWIIDDKLVSTDPSLTVAFDKPGDVYVLFRVETLAGTAEEELKIEVVDMAPPVISLALPSTGLKVLPGTDYTIAPDFQGVDDSFSCQWLRDGKVVAEGMSYTFNESKLGMYEITIRATNEDGTTERVLEIEVVDELPSKVYFATTSYFGTSTDRTAVVGRPLFLSPVLEYIDNPVFEWYVDGALVEGADARTYKYVAIAEGTHEISVKVTERLDVADFSKSRNIARGATTFTAEVTVNCYATAGTPRPATASSLAHQNKVYEFLPAPGQFVNETSAIGGYTGNETTHEAALGYAQKRLEAGTYVSLGAFGGYIVVGFDHSIIAGAGEYDFAIQGNAFGTSNEPGVVWVMQDTNGNGLPDDEWYELRGSETGVEGTVQDYAVTYYRPEGVGMSVRWTDSEGRHGQVDYLKQFHTQPYYYPNWVEADSYTLRGTCLGSQNYVDPSTGYWSNPSYAWGYADNLGTDALLGGNATDGSKQRNGFKISNAMFADCTSVELGFIDFIKVQVGVQGKSGALGEISTEVFGFTDLSIAQ